MEQRILTVSENTQQNQNVFRMTLKGGGALAHRPGQFINIKLDGLYLRRPISIYDAEEDFITVLYKVVGKGTAALSRTAPGSKLDVLTHLGNGFDAHTDCRRPLLVGGGIGCPPLYLLAKELIRAGKTPVALLGFNTAAEVILKQEFENLGCQTHLAVGGFVTDAPVFLSKSYDYLYTCGPLPMLKAVYDNSACGGQYSFEERMGCGFGACMGCSCKTKYGSKRICKDGPVLYKEEIVW